MLIPFESIAKKYNMKIDGILHIGAHDCEELEVYNKYGLNNNEIIWVEANPKIAQRNIKKDNTRIIKNFICCDKDEGTTKLNIANNGQSSSILEFGSHALHHPQVKYNGTIEVKNNRIDTMYKEDNIPNNFSNFVNLDIQGAELLALKGMGELLNNFDYIYTEINKEHLYKNCCLVNEIDEYVSKYNFKRVETKWTQYNWGDALYVKIKSDLKILENVRCTKELWGIKCTLEHALEKAKNDPRVTALHWDKRFGSDARIKGIKSSYQGACGYIGKVSNNGWDTIIFKPENTIAFDIGANIGKWTNSNLHNYDKIITVEASPYTFKKLKKVCNNKTENLLNYAVCDNDGKNITFYQAETDTLSTINKDWLTNTNSRFYNYKYKEIICKTITIDDMIIKYGKPRLIKIDVEGGEYKCIKSLTKKVDFLCFEWASETNDITFKCLDYLITLGFTQFCIQIHDNYIFIPDKKDYLDYSIIKSKLLEMTPKKDWGMIWCK